MLGRRMIPILMVDDSMEDLVLGERVFRQCKIVNPIAAVSSGQECLEFLDRNYRPEPGVEPVRCIVFVDLGMAPMSGVETIENINGLVLTAQPWVIMLSGMTDVKQIRRGYELGARTFINKPLQAPELQEFIDNNHSSIRMRMSADGYELHWM